jgi:hypothetical protein
MQTNTDLTLYSRSIVNRAENWTRSVIENVHWENRKAANQAATGLIEANKVTVYIPTYGRTDEISIKPEDVIVEGIVTKTIDTEYTISDLKAEYDDVVVVKSVDRKDFGSPQLRHLEIGAS